MIGDDTRMVVLDVRGSTVRLGFVAPREVAIHRAETQRKIDATGGMREVAISALAHTSSG